LFEQAEKYLKSKGIKGVDGPVNFGERDKFWGLLIKNFAPPIFMENYHPPYYRAFMSSPDDGTMTTLESGAELSQRMVAGRLVQRLIDGGYTRDCRYRLAPSGTTLNVQVRVTGGQLSGPMQYELTYAKLQ
jgi:hypothetical protein